MALPLAGRIAEDGLEELEGVETDLGRLLDDGPTCLLPLVPLVSRRPDDILGEAMDPLLELDLLLVEVHGELRAWRCRLRRRLYCLNHSIYRSEEHTSEL